MNIRRTIFYDIITDSLKTRAVAMSLFVKQRIKSSAVNNFSYNKLHNLTRLHANTCQRYVEVLIGMGLARFEGKDDNTLVFCSLQSRHAKNNVRLKEIIGKEVKVIAYQLLATFNAEIIEHKNFAKHIIATATNGHKNVKAAQRKARKYGYGRVFKEYGLSFKGIARRLKCGIQKAQHVIKFCVEHGFLVKHRNYEQIYDQQAELRLKLFPWKYTFATKNNLYIVKANTYSLGSRYNEDNELVGYY